MTESRQERRRAIKKKMQPIRVVTQKGGHQVQVLRSSEYERIDHIREDPDFPAFRAVYEWMRERPPLLGCDPMDPWNIPQTLHFATGTVSVDGVPIADAKDIEITIADTERCRGCGGVGAVEFPPGDIVTTKICPRCGGTGHGDN
jgi:hypothetical protein